MQFVEDIAVAQPHRDIEIFFQGHCSDSLLPLAIRKYTIEHLERLNLPSVQTACDKSVRSFPSLHACECECDSGVHYVAANTAPPLALRQRPNTA